MSSNKCKTWPVEFSENWMKIDKNLVTTKRGSCDHFLTNLKIFDPNTVGDGRIQKKFQICSYPTLLGSKNFVLAKHWSQDPLFVVISFLSILSMSSEFSIGHAFHLSNLIFSVVTSFMLLSEEKYQKNKKKKSKNPKT